MTNYNHQMTAVNDALMLQVNDLWTLNDADWQEQLRVIAFARWAVDPQAMESILQDFFS